MAASCTWLTQQNTSSIVAVLRIGHVMEQFAATACTIVSGALAERAKFEAYILYSFFMAAWVSFLLSRFAFCQRAAAKLL